MELNGCLSEEYETVLAKVLTWYPSVNIRDEYFNPSSWFRSFYVWKTKTNHVQ